jgi:hypothetical protein
MFLHTCHRNGIALLPSRLQAAHESGQFFLTLEVATGARTHANELLAQVSQRLPTPLSLDLEADWTKWPMRFRPKLP